jgi:TolB-like protein
VSAFADFVAEARRRRVFRTGGLYIVGAWALLQVADLALEALGLPGELLRYFWYAAFAGFPIALIFGWYYEITADGIRKTLPADSAASEVLPMGVPDYVIIGALAFVVAVGAAGLFDQARQAEELAGPYDPNGIAVLPLENLSGDDDQAYVSAGIHDALITSLSKIGGLRVVSRTSSMRLDRTLTMPAIGEALGVRNIIEGSVTREGNRVRVIVQLIDAANDAHIWAEDFEREFSSVLSLQAEMARAIAKAVDVQLSDKDEQQLASIETVDPDVYDRYLRATYLLNQSNNRVRRRGISILEEIVDRGSADARVYAALAYGYAVLGHSPYPEGMYPASKLAARRAMELDESIPEVHLALGMHALYYDWDFAAAERYLLRAIELNPSLTGAHYHYAWLMELLQRSDKSLPAGDITVDLDPLSTSMRGDLAMQYQNAGRLERAIVIADETLQMNPNADNALAAKATALARMGDTDGAVRVSSMIPVGAGYRFVHLAVLANAGREAEARELLGLFAHEPRNVATLITAYAALGDVEEALHWMRVAKDAKLPWYPWFITWFPLIDVARNDPRFDELAAELGLTEALERARLAQARGPAAT